jgi:cytochrome P450
LINKGFTPRMVKKLEETFTDITTECIDAIIAKGECDLVEDIAVPLPLLLIAEMIGIRREDRQRFHGWSDAMIAGDGNLDNPEIMGKAAAAFMEYSAYTKDIIEDRRKNPREDLVSILVGAKDDGVLCDFGREAIEGLEFSAEQTRLANDELVMLLVLLMVAGNETTRNAISGGMQLLIENPEAKQRLIDDPSLIPAACEEMVRLVSPVHSFGRTATQDTEIAGQPIKKGDKILIIYPAANSDPRAFENPDVFDIDRHPQHLGFGMGTHFCMGANLARMEMRVAFEQLLKRMPDIEYADAGPRIVPSALVRNCAEMRVKFTPES